MQNGQRKDVAAVRNFNRFYTKRLGLLEKGFLKTRFPLIQARILFELAQQEQSTATKLKQELGVDAGYLSRILTTFEKDGLVRRSTSQTDSRLRLLRLTAKGRKAFSTLDARSQSDVEKLLNGLTSEEHRRLLGAMAAIEELLHVSEKPVTAFLLRPHEPGDIGWITYRHGVLYAEEYGFDETFEALVAEILAKFIQNHEPKRERIWIAEWDGERVGSIMLVDAGKGVAQLRLLLVEPKVRGKGLGARLIDECIKLSKRQGYRKIKLWTQSNLLEARHLYTKAGFEIVEEKSHHSFGHDLIAEIWERNLY
ncbi:helix-turn-helix domain-containing GNAT family N-acetyltransferase [bacterium]|nr:helix-turn-helix domain-containing GNAT family N-acetyltransferase [bacterium]